MSQRSRMLKISDEEIQLNHLLPYEIVTADGAVLVKNGLAIILPEQVDIVRAYGWRIVGPEDKSAVTQEEAIKRMEKTDIQFPVRKRRPLESAEALIVDDMVIIREILKDLLEDFGIKKIRTASSGNEAIPYFFEHRPEMVFLDINMPGIDGISVLKQIKQWAPETFVCMVSGNSSVPIVRKVKSYGVDAFLVKPISMQNLERMLAVYNKGYLPKYPYQTIEQEK